VESQPRTKAVAKFERTSNGFFAVAELGLVGVGIAVAVGVTLGWFLSLGSVGM